MKLFSPISSLRLFPRLGTRGATALEFAIVIPILLFLIMGIVEYSLILYGTSVLDGAVSEAAREGSTGYAGTTSGATQQQFVYGLVQQHAGGLLDPGKIQIASQSFPDFSSGPSQPHCVPNQPCPASVGGAGDVVEYTVTYPWPIATPLLATILGVSGDTYPLSASAVVRNEPYNDPTQLRVSQ